MLDWKVNLDTLIEETMAFTRSVRVEPMMPRTVVEPSSVENETALALSDAFEPKMRCSIETFAARDGVRNTIDRQTLRRSCGLTINDIHNSRLESRSERHNGPHRTRRCRR
jgi:hypothetical protein